MAITEDIAILASEDCKLIDSVYIWYGTGTDADDSTTGDIKAGWDGSNFVYTLNTADTGAIQLGSSGAGIDLQLYGDTATYDVLWDQSADSLIFNDNAKIVFGTGSDVTVRWDATDLDILAGADDQVIKFGNGTSSFDIWLYGETANDYVEWDASASNLKLVGDARLDLSSCTTLAANTDGGVFKAGTSGSRVVEDTADMKFMAAYFDNGATSGDNRGFYLRLYLTGAGGGGEALRAFTDCEDVACGTAHGAHISLKFGSTGSITGLGVANRNTLHIPNQAMTGGTYASVMPEIWGDGASSTVAGMTECSLIRAVLGGNATAIAEIDDNAFFLTLTGGSVASGNMFAAKTSSAVSHGIRMKAPDGNTYYIMVSDTQ